MTEVTIQPYTEEFSSQMTKFELFGDEYHTSFPVECFIALKNNCVVGFQSVMNGYCIEIEVLPEYRRQGIATALVHYTGIRIPEVNECPKFWRTV